MQAYGGKRMLLESGDNIFIIATSPALLDAEEQGADRLSAALNVMPPDSWPPQYHGPQTRAWMHDMLAAHPDDPGYGNWYIVAGNRLTGICGFKGPPGATGEVEIGYSVIQSRQRNGFATAAVRLLLARTFRDPRVSAVVAETLPSLIASQTVLTRNGFALASRRTDGQLGEILRFVLPRQG